MKSNIIILCPPKFATGGTELLHQLGAELNRNQKKASIFYYGEYEGDPVASRFKKYNVPYVDTIENSDSNCLVIPETATMYVNKKEYSKCKKYIWWMSVDNYTKFLPSTVYERIKYFVKETLFKSYNVNKKDKKDTIHLVQSYYAYNFLSELGKEEIYFLSDYLNDDYLNIELSTSNERENIVLYNPKKGYDFTKQIIEKMPSVKFVALENMTPEEIKQLLLKSKVYIDFGNHPGKDRFPREAAIGGCCIITSKRGSANFYEDVKIDNEYKFEDIPENINAIISKVSECLEEYEKKSNDFVPYINKIKEEKELFTQEVMNVFGDK